MFTRLRGARRLSGAMLVLSLAGCSGGPSHIHNPADQKLAERARDQAETLADAERAVLETMLSNVERLKERRDDAYAQLRDGFISGRSTLVTGMTWREFRTSVGGASGSSPVLRDIEAHVEDLLTEIRDSLPGAVTDTRDANVALREAKAATTEAEETVNGWRRRLAVLEKVAEMTPGLAADREVEGWDGFKDWLEEQAEAFQAQRVTFTNTAGKQVEEPLLDAIEAVADDSHEDGDRDTGRIIDTVKSVFPRDAPGLVLVMTGLSRDLAEIEHARASARLQALRRRLPIIEKAEEDLRTARDLLEDASNLAGDTTAFPDDETVTETIDRLAQAGDEDPLADTLEAIQNYVVVSGPLYAGVMTALRDDAHQQHLDSIRRSQLAASQHQALVSRGVEGLVAYHSGGVRPDEVADLVYRVVQVSILGVIAGRVD